MNRQGHDSNKISNAKGTKFINVADVKDDWTKLGIFSKLKNQPSVTRLSKEFVQGGSMLNHANFGDRS